MAIEKFNQIQASAMAQEQVRDNIVREIGLLRQQRDSMRSELSSFKELSGRYERLRSHCDNYMSGGHSVLELFDEKEKKNHSREYGPAKQERS